MDMINLAVQMDRHIKDMNNTLEEIRVEVDKLLSENRQLKQKYDELFSKWVNTGNE